MPDAVQGDVVPETQVLPQVVGPRLRHRAFVSPVLSLADTSTRQAKQKEIGNRFPPS